MTTIDLETLNRSDRAGFTSALGEIFEHSPWVAERAWSQRSFADVAALHRAMSSVVLAASREEQLALLLAHPELAGKLAQAGQLTASSTQEQAGAGLNALSADELARISSLNAQYRAKFGFPFIVAVRNYTKRGIFRELERRLENDAQTEFRTGLEQVCEIGLIRLEALFNA
jgi:2-oxo-4-hydroxy-4-carboxy-5-ureidoimidazoline decarboxylase